MEKMTNPVIKRTRLLLLRGFGAIYKSLGEKGFFIIVGLLTGIISGLAAAAVKYIVESFHTLPALLNNHGLSIITFLLPLLGITGAYLIARSLAGKNTYEKSLSSLIHQLSINRPDMPWYKTFSHLLTSGLAVGCGGAAGLEAPIVMTGAAIGANTGKLFRLDPKQKTLLLGCGAAAGISAIFNSPIAGVLFVAEVLLPEFSVSALVPVLLASATSAVVAKALHSEQLFLLVSDNWAMNAIPWYFLLGAICALTGVYMIRTSYMLSALIRTKLSKPLLRLVVCGLLLCVLLAVIPATFGEGYSLVKILFTGNYGELPALGLSLGGSCSSTGMLMFIGAAAILLKVVGTTLTVEGGGDGGIFAPSMFAGAFTGFVFAHGINMTGITQLNEPNFIAAGMCGVFTAVMRAPMTGIFLIAEVTGGYILLIPLMIVSAIAFFAARYFEPYSVYTKTLAERHMLFEDKDHAILQRITVSSIIERNFTPVHKDESFRRLADLISTTSSTIFPVLDSGDILIGVAKLESIRSVLLTQEAYELLLVYDVMDEPKGVLHPDDPLTRAMSHFEIFDQAYLPVSDQNGRYVGFVSKAGVLTQYRSLVKQQAPAF